MEGEGGMERVVVIINRDLLVSQFHLSVLTPDTGQIVNHSESNLSGLLKNYSSLDNKKIIPSANLHVTRR